MNTNMYLLSIIPNQQTRLMLQDLRHSLYRVCGIASALALEPVIPVTILNHKPEKDKVMRLLTPSDSETIAPPVFTLTSAAVYEGHIFIEIIEDGTVRQIRERIAPLHADETEASGPFPLYPGLFTACIEGMDEEEPLNFVQTELTRRSSMDRDRETGLQWKSSRIGLYSLSFRTDNEQWWDGVQWGLEWQFPFRKWII